MRWVLLILLGVLCVIAALWGAMLAFLPDAPVSGEGAGTPHPVAAIVPPVPIPLDGSPPALLAVPVAGVARREIQDNWGDPRDNGLRLHHGTDIIAPGGTLVTAAAPGTIEKLFQSKAGGTTIYERSPDRRWIYYYAHLSGYAAGLQEGQVMKTGDPIGYVGDTGDAGAGNFHLHFGLTRTTPEQRWHEGEDINPYPYLAGKRASG
jgi:murein DD-endopeptidase MepM/ murein hydrolase activator NlpD